MPFEALAPPPDNPAAYVPHDLHAWPYLQFLIHLLPPLKRPLFSYCAGRSPLPYCGQLPFYDPFLSI